MSNNPTIYFFIWRGHLLINTQIFKVWNDNWNVYFHILLHFLLDDAWIVPNGGLMPTTYVCIYLTIDYHQSILVNFFFQPLEQLESLPTPSILLAHQPHTHTSKFIFIFSIIIDWFFGAFYNSLPSTNTTLSSCTFARIQRRQDDVRTR